MTEIMWRIWPKSSHEYDGNRLTNMTEIMWRIWLQRRYCESITSTCQNTRTRFSAGFLRSFELARRIVTCSSCQMYWTVIGKCMRWVLICLYLYACMYMYTYVCNGQWQEKCMRLVLMCLCLHVCMYLYTYVCNGQWQENACGECWCVYVCMYVCTCVRMDSAGKMHAMRAGINVCMYTCIYMRM